ncbi:hypothetical protein MPDQ_000620 [Monascus purpureus]|uniref:Outer kinetochore protein DAD1 n=1 Tax=Monascus purpureus TaxID=5098 RepID=A0A507QTI5_MONPU|nr:hypothetical protein MPDQ_000620 [Monascus purpureus]
MRDMPSRFIEILDAEDSSHLRMSASDVRLEDVLADHEATVNRRRSSTQSSSSKVGKEFGSVEALWSQFENFMVRPDEEGDSKQNGENEDDHENENEHEHEHEYEHGDEEGDTEYN